MVHVIVDLRELREALDLVFDLDFAVDGKGEGLDCVLAVADVRGADLLAVGAEG